MTTERDAYAVLHVAPEAPQEVIQAAYRALARRFHPDGSEPQADRMKLINLAYERVRSPERRAAYDQERRQLLVPMGPGRATHPAPSVANSVYATPPNGAHTNGHAYTNAYAQASGHAYTNGASATPPPPFGYRSPSAAVPDDADVLDFGAYAGWRIAQIARHDPDYLRWLSRHSAGVRYLEAIRRVLPGEKDLGRRSNVGLDW